MDFRPALRALIIVTPLVCATAQGQPAFPSKPVRIITAAVGGASDFTARMLAQGLGANLGQQFIVDNRGGANGIIAGEMVAHSLPDGYTLLYSSNSMINNQLVKAKPPFDVLRDFEPVSLLTTSPNLVVVHPSVPAKSIVHPSCVQMRL